MSTRYEEALQALVAWDAARHPHLKAPPSNRLTMPFDVAIAQADTIVSHPGWQFFLNALKARVDTLQEAQAAAVRQLVDSTDGNVDTLLALKNELRFLNGQLDGLQFAASLIPTLVDAGVKGRQAAAAGVADQRASSLTAAAGQPGD